MEGKVSDLLFRPILPSRHIYHRGKKFRLGRAAERTIDLLREITFSPACQSTSGLLLIRPRIRGLLAHPTPVILCYSIDRTSHARTLRIAIWLLGRIGHPYATPSVAAHIGHPNFRVRREVVRALRRLHAWGELRRINRQHPDPITRAIAVQVEPRPYADRLVAFVGRVEPVPSIGSTDPLVLAPGLDFESGRPPKNRWQIGAMLRRIRRLVRGRKRRSRCGPGFRQRLRAARLHR